MSEDDPLKKIFLKGIFALFMSIFILFFLKPSITFAADFFVCGTCDEATFVLTTVIVLAGAIMIPMYKLIGVFYN